MTSSTTPIPSKRLPLNSSRNGNLSLILLEPDQAEIQSPNNTRSNSAAIPAEENTIANAYLAKVTVPGAGLTDEDRDAAKWAWAYFNRNWNSNTGMVNAVENYRWSTLWDQGSAILGIHSARQLGLISEQEFDQKMRPLLQTLKSLSLPDTNLPNKAYSTSTGLMRTLQNTADPSGSSGWSALDMARLLLSLHVIRTHYPQYRLDILQAVKRWDIDKLTNDGWLQGGRFHDGKLQLVQEGRLGYEQYAAKSLRFWDLDVAKAEKTPPIEVKLVESVPLNVDKRNLSNSGASNYLSNDPYLLWGIELGWNEEVKSQVVNLLKAQRKRYQRTQILTAVNEDSLDREPYFIYGSVITDGKSWNTTTSKGTRVNHLRHLSTKAAFAWSSLLPKEPYAKQLRNAVQTLADQSRGYYTGRYENKELGINKNFNVNTNAIVLESLLYKARKNHPLVSTH